MTLLAKALQNYDYLIEEEIGDFLMRQQQVEAQLEAQAEAQAEALVEDQVGTQCTTSVETYKIAQKYSCENTCYYYIYNVNFNDDIINFDLKYHGVNLQCEMELDERIRKFKCYNPSFNRHKIRMLKDGIKADANLIARYDKNTYDEFARMFFYRYGWDREIEDIAINTLKLNICRDYNLKNETCGIMCLNDEDIETKDGVKHISAYTILIDKNLTGGRYRYTLLHEMVHYIKDRYFLWLKKLVGANDINEKRVENQAAAMPAYILCPSGEISRAYQKLCETYKGMTDKEEMFVKIISELALEFRVSKQCVRIRIQDLKLNTYGVDLESANTTHYLSDDEMVNVYLTDEQFKYMLNNGKIVRFNNSFVYDKFKDTKTFNYYHPSEALVTFNRERVVRYATHINYFERMKITDELYFRMSKNCSDEELKLLENIKNEDKLNECFAFDIGKTIKNLRLFRKKSLDTLSSTVGIGKYKLMDIEEGRKDKFDIDDLVLIFKALRIPRDLTKRTLSKFCDNFEATLESRLIGDTINNYYDECEFEEFKEKVNNAKALNKKIIKVG